MRPQETLIASFGDAQILKHIKGKLEIRGGIEEEKAQAHAWGLPRRALSNLAHALVRFSFLMQLFENQRMIRRSFIMDDGYLTTTFCA